MIDLKKIKEAVKRSHSYAEASRHLGGKLSAKSIKRLIDKHDISTEHFDPVKWIRQPLKKILVKNSSYASTSRLRKRLVEEGLLENECQMCGLGPEWNGLPLTLQLDHINGDNRDNRIKNLRVLCPNCHTQTPTYGAKNYKS